jgi:hypothetical protein
VECNVQSVDPNTAGHRDIDMAFVLVSVAERWVISGAAED